MSTLHPDPPRTRTALSAIVLLALGASQAAPPGVAIPRTAGLRPPSDIPLGRIAEGRLSERTTVVLAAPQFEAQTDAHVFALDVRNTSPEAIDWILAIELLDTASEPGGVTLTTSTTGGVTWSTPLYIDTSGNPAFCVVPPLVPSLAQAVHFRIWTPHTTGTTHFSLEASIVQSYARSQRRKPPRSWLSRS